MRLCVSSGNKCLVGDDAFVILLQPKFRWVDAT